jgi:YHS domain-containing protein
MYAYLSVFVRVRMWVCIRARTYVPTCMYAYEHVCTSVRARACVRVIIYTGREYYFASSYAALELLDEKKAPIRIYRWTRQASLSNECKPVF